MMYLGFFGVQLSLGLTQSAVNPLFLLIGASPEQLPILNLARPVTGLVIQPLIKAASDRTWSSLGPSASVHHRRRIAVFDHSVRLPVRGRHVAGVVCPLATELATQQRKTPGRVRLELSSDRPDQGFHL
jgi:hypothetical protein